MTALILHPEFMAFLSLLTPHGVRFRVVAAYALAALARARVTNYIDIQPAAKKTRTASSTRKAAKPRSAWALASERKKPSGR